MMVLPFFFLVLFCVRLILWVFLIVCVWIASGFLSHAVGQCKGRIQWPVIFGAKRQVKDG